MTDWPTMKNTVASDWRAGVEQIAQASTLHAWGSGPGADTTSAAAMSVNQNAWQQGGASSEVQSAFDPLDRSLPERPSSPDLLDASRQEDTAFLQR